MIEEPHRLGTDQTIEVLALFAICERRGEHPDTCCCSDRHWTRFLERMTRVTKILNILKPIPRESPGWRSRGWRKRSELGRNEYALRLPAPIFTICIKQTMAICWISRTQKSKNRASPMHSSRLPVWTQEAILQGQASGIKCPPQHPRLLP